VLGTITSDFQEEPGAGKPHARICEGGAVWPSYSTTLFCGPGGTSLYGVLIYGSVLYSRRTGITAYHKNGGVLEKAASMANHASTRTTQLYDRRRDEASLDEVERISI